ncbi:MAG: CBS domain-containing protein [Bryobacteraceae bacterium]
MKPADSIRFILENKGCAVWSLPPEASVYEAIKMMSEKQVGALLVMKNNRLVGFISERDYARKVILQGRSSRDTAVSEIMSAPVTTVSPAHTIDECMRLMTSSRIRHLPVVEHGQVSGIVSIGDLVRWTISSQEETIHQLHSYIAGAYPG